MSERITQARLKEVLRYDPESGNFYWASWRFNSIPVGARAGSRNIKGYWVIPVDRKVYQAHRLAWLYQTGAWPADQIDHINRVKTDNRWANLREATNAQNAQNRPRRVDNTSGIAGVHWHNGKWQARIGVYGRRLSLGHFESKEDAHAVYKAAKAKLHIPNPLVSA